MLSSMATIPGLRSLLLNRRSRRTKWCSRASSSVGSDLA
jgi:hypothetical protein